MQVNKLLNMQKQFDDQLCAYKQEFISIKLDLAEAQKSALPYEKRKKLAETKYNRCRIISLCLSLIVFFLLTIYLRLNYLLFNNLNIIIIVSLITASVIYNLIVFYHRSTYNKKLILYNEKMQFIGEIQNRYNKFSEEISHSRNILETCATLMKKYDQANKDNVNISLDEEIVFRSYGGNKWHKNPLCHYIKDSYLYAKNDSLCSNLCTQCFSDLSNFDWYVKCHLNTLKTRKKTTTSETIRKPSKAYSIIYENRMTQISFENVTYKI